MAKPKFTPDPVPDGMDPQLAEYLSRQLNRIEDWWPKDYEDRIQALEQLAPYCTGTWPIVDYSSITFESVAEIVLGPCSQAEEFPSGSAVKIENCQNLDYSSPYNVVIASGQPFNATGRSLVAFNATTGAVEFSITNCTRLGHKIASTPGTNDRKLLIHIAWPCGSTGARTANFYDISSSYSYIGGVSLGSINTEILAERDADVLYPGLSVAGFINKSTRALTSATLPGGWFGPYRAAATSSSAYLMCLWNGSNFGFSSYTSGGSISTPTALGNIGGTVTGAAPANPQVVGSSVWWVFNTNDGTELQWLVETDFSGTLIQSVPKFDGQSIVETRSGADQLWYESANNSLYYMYNTTIWRYDISADTYHQCTPDFETTAPGVGRSSSLIRVDGYHWDVFLDAPTWSIEKIAASF